MQSRFYRGLAAAVVAAGLPVLATASSHREAPLIAADPLADNTDVYAFRSPDDPSTVTLIANYIPMQLPQGGPNYYHFSDNVRYEIHVDNDASVAGDEVTYRFTFARENEDPTTFFNIRLGAENIATSYTLERSTDGGQTFETIVTNGMTPPYNIGPRSITGGAGLGSTYSELFNGAIETASTGERVFAGPVDDPFFVDFSVFDLGDAPRQDGEPRDGLACFNVHTLAIQVPISTLLKDGAPAEPSSILDGDYVIGVWASASRPATRTLTMGDAGDTDATAYRDYTGDFVQVSRLGMPLTNEVVIPIGLKDYWNAITPYDELADTRLDPSFYNPELGLYMDDDQFGGAVPAFAPLRIQENSLGSFDFTNGADGLFGLKGSEALDGTALSEEAFGSLLLPGPGQPRSVDLWPAFHTGVPNLAPYQLATGKDGNPLAVGKPFVNNFLPNGGDMLRLNMAVPVTPRGSADFSSEGLIQAAVLGLTDPRFNASADLQFIPNVDGFPNGRRLEDDVTRIELQAVSGVVLAAIGLWYDDYDPNTSPSPVTQDLLDVLTYTTGVEENDLPFSSSFPYEAMPRSGTGPCSGDVVAYDSRFTDLELSVNLITDRFQQFTEIPYMLKVTNAGAATATDVVVDAGLVPGLVFTSANPSQGEYNLFFEEWRVGDLAPGQTATLRLTLFALVDRPITNFFEVESAGGADFDSDPGNNQDGEADEDDEAVITVNPGRGGGGGGEGTADLSLALRAERTTVGQYEEVPYVATVTNDGPDAAENVVVSIGLPSGLVYTRDDPSQGDYNLFFEEWNVGTLASGQSATLRLTLFTLVEGQDVTQFAQVLGVDQSDPDSAPGNNQTRSPREDDEAIAVISVADRFGESGPEFDAFAFGQRLGNAEMVVYPTVMSAGSDASYQLTMDAAEVELRVVNALGQVLSSRQLTPSGATLAGELPLGSAAPGYYLVQAVVDGQSVSAQRIVIQ